MLKKGFTLFELAVCCTLCCLLFSFSAHVVGLTTRLALLQELDRLHAVILFMQRKALLDDKTYTLVFSQEKDGYQAGAKHTFCPSVRFEGISCMQGPPASPGRPIKDAITWLGHTIYFYPNGTISAGSVYLTNDTNTLYCALTCDIGHINHIRRYFYTNTWNLIQ